MAHQRKVIRDAVVSSLIGATGAGARVYPTRTYPIDEASLPAICVYTLNETSEINSLGAGRSLRRSLDLIVEAIAKVNDTLDDVLDQLALEIEVALGSNFTLGGNAYSCVLDSTKITVRGEAEKETGSAVLGYSVSYRTPFNDPSINSI